MPSTDSDPSDRGSLQSPQLESFSPQLSDSSVFSPVPSHSAADPLHPPAQPLQPPFSNGKHSSEAEDEALEEPSYYHSFHSNGGDSQTDASVFEENCQVLNGGGDGGGDGGAACGTVFDFREAANDESHDGKEDGCRSAPEPPRPPHCGAFDDPEQSPLVPMTLYLHRVKGLVLALLVEPHFLSDTASMEEVVRNNPVNNSHVDFHFCEVCYEITCLYFFF